MRLFRKSKKILHKHCANENTVIAEAVLVSEMMPPPHVIATKEEPLLNNNFHPDKQKIFALRQTRMNQTNDTNNENRSARAKPSRETRSIDLVKISSIEQQRTHSFTVESNIKERQMPFSPEDKEAFAIMRKSALPNPQSVVMAQLIHWKFAAEHGSFTLRIPAILAAIGLMATTVMSFVYPEGEYSSYLDLFTPGRVILGFHTFVMSLLICLIDGRTRYARDPLGFRAMLRNATTRHLNVLKLVWGRGLLYIMAGTLSIGLETFYSYISGGFMVFIGALAYILGSRASRQLRLLRRAITDEEFLRAEFLDHDRDGDGFLSRPEFAQFIIDLGMEFDDLYTLKAFSTIDLDSDQRVTYPDFLRWWSQIRVEEI